MPNKHLLIVEDEFEISNSLQIFFQDEGYNVTCFPSAIDALEIYDKPDHPDFDLILSDVNLPGMSGHQFVRSLGKILPELPPIIMMTAYGSIESAVEAMKIGAFDYLTKPFMLNDLQAKVDRILKFRAPKIKKNFWQSMNIVGDSPAIIGVFDIVRRVAKVDSSVFILGESGTGKELVARAVHRFSHRADKPFVAINCAAIPENLLESELFGHSKGAFTGAFADKKGLIEEADGGVLFLDEIGDMNISLQAKLLRFIQERKVKPVGLNQFREVDVRIISATHRNIVKSMESGTFREDLYYRLNVMPIEIPPLRERPGDIQLLAEHFREKFASQSQREIRGFTTSALERLRSSHWKGNVRQLANVIERAVILCDKETIDDEHIMQISNSWPEVKKFETTNLSIPTFGSLQTFAEMEKQGMIMALEKAQGNKEESARLLGISRKTFYRKEKEYGIKKQKSQISGHHENQ